MLHLVLVSSYYQVCLYSRVPNKSPPPSPTINFSKELDFWVWELSFPVEKCKFGILNKESPSPFVISSESIMQNDISHIIFC